MKKHNYPNDTVKATTWAEIPTYGSAGIHLTDIVGLDNQYDLVHAGRLTLIKGEDGSGKTYLANQIASNIAAQEMPTLVVTCTDSPAVRKHAIAAQTIPDYDVKAGDSTSQLLNREMNSINDRIGNNMYILGGYDSSAIEEVLRTRNLSLVVLDDFENAEEEMIIRLPSLLRDYEARKMLMSDLIRFTRVYRVSIIVVSRCLRRVFNDLTMVRSNQWCIRNPFLSTLTCTKTDTGLKVLVEKVESSSELYRTTVELRRNPITNRIS